tara:strand:- start:27670 stop:28674 length:1005 start_codon:yes stop_codon:yes gene_type:complete
MAKPRIAINGFGRIGRILFRAGFEDLDIVAINDPGGIETAAHLLKYDSSHGIFPAEVKVDGETLVVGEQKIRFIAERDPKKLPWKDLEVDIVMECTGVFKSKEDANAHLEQGAKRVLISAPAKNVDLTMVYGINHKDYKADKDYVVSNASCTTNCLAPIAKVLNDSFGIEYGMMTTVHSYTNDQRILDSAHKDLRRARSAAVSMIPTTTGAAVAVTKVLPELTGKLDGMAIRVPTPNVSVVDLNAQLKTKVSVEEVNQALKEAANGPLKGVLAFEEKELVSIDFNGNPHSSIVDGPSTAILGDHFVKVLSWYDNEVGFSHRMVDFAKYIHEVGI